MSFQNYSQPTPLFDTFGASQFSSVLFLFASINFLVTFPGLLFNPALLYATIRSKKLRSPSSVLLAIGSVCDFVYLLSFVLPFVLTLSGRNFIHFNACFYLIAFPILDLFSSVWVVFFVGLDRLICVLFPFHYVQLEQHLALYLAPMLLVIFGYSAYMIGLGGHYAFQYPDMPVLCSSNDLFAYDGTGTVALHNGLAINFASFVCYGLVGLALLVNRKKIAENTEAANKNRIFKSLAAIMILVVGSYFAICAIMLATQTSGSAFYLFHVLPCIFAVLTSTAASSNAPLLYAFSREYRREFNKAFRHWPLLGQLVALNGDQSTALHNIHNPTTRVMVTKANNYM